MVIPPSEKERMNVVFVMWGSNRNCIVPTGQGRHFLKTPWILPVGRQGADYEGVVLRERTSVDITHGTESRFKPGLFTQSQVRIIAGFGPAKRGTNTFPSPLKSRSTNKGVKGGGAALCSWYWARFEHLEELAGSIGNES
uniref:Uncharacterized protein n=1 Tax=Timema bartmani TaxID=61472 RepID=A0A7R9I3R8_9NEOP|nr:unnamed protein product [Timema bartmani]